MASDNARHFELKLRKLGLFMLICSMAGLLFAVFLLGVVVGNNLDTYPEVISRQMPVKVLQWLGLSEVEKIPPPSVVIKTEKAVPKEDADTPGLISRDVVPPPPPSIEMDTAKNDPPMPEQPKVKTPVPPSQVIDKAVNKEKVVAPSLPKEKDKASASQMYVVQITSCKSKKSAEDTVKQLGKIGFHAKIVTAEIKNKGTWYRVLLSDIEGKDKAKAAAEKIDRVLKGNKSIIRIQNR